MNLQQSLAAGPRIRLELAAPFELCMTMFGSSFGTFFLWRAARMPTCLAEHPAHIIGH